jgi:hypothetical protein
MLRHREFWVKGTVKFINICLSLILAALNEQGDIKEVGIKSNNQLLASSFFS